MLKELISIKINKTNEKQNMNVNITGLFCFFDKKRQISTIFLYFIETLQILEKEAKISLDGMIITHYIKQIIL